MKKHIGRLFVFFFLMGLGICIAGPDDSRVSVDFKQAFALDILKLVAMRGGMNIVVSKKGGNVPVTVNFTDLTCVEAFGRVTSQAGLTMRRLGSSTFVFLDAGAPPPSEEIQHFGPGFSSETISLDFRQADIRDLLRIIAKKAGVNILPHKSVRGNVSCLFRDLPWNEALRALLIGCRLEAVRCGDTVVVGDSRILCEMSVVASNSTLISASKRSLQVNDTDIRDAFGLAANSFGRSFLTGVSVRGNVTVSLLDLPENELLPLLARANGFDAVFLKGVWILDDGRLVSTYQEKLSGFSNATASEGIQLSFRDSSCADVLRLVAAKAPFSVKIEVPADLKITLNLKDVSPVFALHALAVAGRLSCEEQPDKSLYISSGK
ncbi:MAG: hypothetical protein WA705_27735 [Candidatus Ozemobacteraceae bacterium]